MISKIVLQRAASSLILGVALLASGCVSVPKGQTVIVGKAVDSKNGQALVGKPVKALDIRTYPSPFGIPRPPIIAVGTTGAGGKFRLVANGQYKDKWVTIWFEGVSVPFEGSKEPSDTWRIVDVAVTPQK